jgi:hypothetical protein
MSNLIDRERESLATFATQALTAIIIVVSPNIVSMVTTKPNVRNSNIEFPLDQILRRANANPESTTYLSNLRSVYMISKTESTWEDGRFYIGMDLHGFMKIFHNLPSIESVSTDVMEEDPNGSSDFKEKSSKISKISIHHSSMGSLYLVRLLWSCKALKEFQYSIGGRSSNDGGYHIFNPKAFIKALCDHKNTLEILDVDTENRIHEYHEYDPEDREQFDSYGSPFEPGIDDEECKFLKSNWEKNGSLREFVSLKRLSLGVEFLLHFAQGTLEFPTDSKDIVTVADCLPDSLEYLCVRGYEKGAGERGKFLDEQMNALMAFYKSGKSQLKELKGIEETVPNSDHVDNPDQDEHLLWSFKEDSDEESDEGSEDSESDGEE